MVAMQAGKREMWREQVTMDAITNLPLACALVVDAKGEDAHNSRRYGLLVICSG